MIYGFEFKWFLGAGVEFGGGNGNLIAGGLGVR